MGKYNSDWIERNVYYKPVPSPDDPATPRYAQYERPVIVVLCGSTKFADAYLKAAKDETLAGKIVLSVGTFGHLHRSRVKVDGCMGEQEAIVLEFRPDAGMSVTPEQKEMLDELHMRKIDLADEALILNVGGYVGSSTRNELAYARKLGKTVRWLEPDNVPDDLK